MSLSTLYNVAILCLSVSFAPARADLVGHVGIADSECQAKLDARARTSVQRVSRPLIEGKRPKVALASVISDFDPERDVVVGINPKKHTYLVNAQIGRHDPGIFGGRGRFHENTQVRHLTVSPGLVMRLRLPAPVVSRVAAEMNRVRDLRSLTCTNTTARTLGRAGVPGMSSFTLTPIQMLRGIIRAQNLDARFYLVNSEAEDLNDFEDGVKVIGAKKNPTPPPDTNGRQKNSACCNGEDSCEIGMIACFDLDSCSGSSQGSECSSGESGCSEGGGSDCDSNCCD